MKFSRKLLKAIVVFYGLSITTPIVVAQDFPAYDIPLAQQEKPTETKAAIKRRKPPNFPPPLNRSGFCCVAMDVTEEGMPENVSASFCTEKKFKRTSLESVSEWRFNPALINGKPVRSTQQSHIITYKITDERDRIVPDRKRLVLYKGRIDFSHDRLCLKPIIS